ncbi:uncharacterized protein BCR38DRAFT_485944 [Pseudomassariella vexata]|uniref:SigF-like NTF2-like domain-containing protein n=1 Tax=Pseudomassariella vexata TaxID=1141098 RepID=A0A1Y2DVA6_9PEZI|nr:uncharacterized protein BCR38DRAFT_485944 [Pseudomassariella vexata]ORY63178.1 hypothetical protein BCR38DRAFT_485944 [Pseudomassariella vexata]
MEHPVHEIGGVIAALCQGTAEEQEVALKDYYTPDAYFVHPFCRVPSFSGFELPFIGTKVDSRFILKFVYQWYRILSPQIDIKIDSTVFDQRQRLLYLTIRQVFTIWIVPFSLWQAHVKLVTVLKLDALREGPNGQLMPGDGGNAPSNGNARTKYYIRGQEDLYQVNEFVKFVAPFGAHFVWTLWQWFATFLCIVGVVLFWPLTAVRNYVLQKGAQWKLGAKRQ